MRLGRWERARPWGGGSGGVPAARQGPDLSASLARPVRGRKPSLCGWVSDRVFLSSGMSAPSRHTCTHCWGPASPGRDAGTSPRMGRVGPGREGRARQPSEAQDRSASPAALRVGHPTLGRVSAHLHGPPRLHALVPLLNASPHPSTLDPQKPHRWALILGRSRGKGHQEKGTGPLG